ncbi:MAG: hypothetical protein GY810_02650 [Aureispira sp.]|nr:hypothetical protein [Aureispira sp.]
MSNTTWEIAWSIIRDRGSYFESDTKYEITIRHKKNRQIFKTFWRSEYASTSGEYNSGAKDFKFLEDGKTLLVNYENGKKETFELPLT